MSGDAAADSGGRRYPLAGMDRLFTGMTWALLVLMAVMAVGFTIAAVLAPEAWLGIPVAVFIAIVVAGVWCYGRPSEFMLTNDCLRIRFPIRTRQVPLAEIVQAGPITKADAGFVLRLWGAGGLWGGFGLMWSRTLRTFDAYVSNLHRMVRIERRNARPLVISVDDPDAFVADLQSRVGQ